MSREPSRTNEEESKPRTAEKKTKKKSHVHIGPNARAYRTGRASCPVCDAEKIVRITDREREIEKTVRDLRKRQSYQAA